VIIFVAGTPPALQQALGWQVAGLNPLGWPLVIGAVVGALTILIVVVGIAFDRIRDLILNGP
ncbi:MAG: hypothetical protein QOF33_853, partial [Thermomicrobiales bacterium]|nr:hypothetical protein [Thermomicrobiales bacterium]